MDIVKLSVEKPVSVSVGVILILLFGIIGLQSMPYQLTPRVTEPEISVQTTWPGATPYEIERDVVDEQEEVLKGLRGLVEMESTSFDGFGEVLLTFQVGTEIDDALLRVSNALNEVEAYPENVDRPVIESSGATESPVVWTMLKPNQGNDRPIRTYLTFFEDEVRQYLERIEGVSGLFVRGGTEREMQVVIDPIRLAAYSLTIEDVIRLLRAENANISAGNLGVSRRDYRIRTVAQFQSPQEIENLIITSTGQRRVRIKDVGHVHDGYEKQTGATLSNGDYGIVIGVRPQPDANILDLTDRVEEVVTELNEGLLADNDVHIEWLNDRRYYILGAIDLVQQNILIGGGLAILVLLVFLRRPSSTLVVATAIPISVVGSFIFMNALGRNLNIVSMAGISFAVGMLVDNAIVVLENIDRHRNMGKSPYDAAAQGAREVWGAVLASTLTTVAVFLPIVFIQEEAGQLFKDIAIAITCAILISLFVSISVIPMLSRKVLRYFGSSRRRLPGSRLIERAGGVLHHGMMATVGLALRNALTRLATIVLLTSLAVGITVAFFPKMEYLPEGNRNLILSILIPPPGLSFEERTEIGWQVWDKMQPYFRKQTGEYPPIELMFYVSSPTFNIFGASSQDYARPAELIPLMNAIMRELPGMYGVSTQASIFQQGIGEGRTIKVDLSGPDIAALTQAAGAMFGMITKAIPEAQIRPLPSLEMSYPEIGVAPDRERVRAAGMTARELGEAIDVLMDGRIIGDYKQEGEKTFDLVLKASEQDIETPEELLAALVATPTGRAVPVSSLARPQRTTGLTQIRHLERRRTVTLQVTPPATLPLQAAMETIENEVIPNAREAGLLGGIAASLSGAADKLTVTAEVLRDGLILALIITYLLMSSLFGNFLYPLIIMFTVPLAAAGGFLGLKLQNVLLTPQPLDVLTMLGFIILVGVVVNNAILIVHQSLNNVREHGMGGREAVLDATSSRLRPIYMSATTSIFGMLPLAIAPGPGSELYRGLGSVVLGGLALSTVFTVFVIPSLLLFFIGMERPGSAATAHDSPEPASTADDSAQPAR